MKWPQIWILTLALQPKAVFAENWISLIPYLAEQGFKQGALLLRTQDVDALIKDPKVDPETKKFLQLSKDVLQFAESWGFKTGGNYRRYLRLNRDWVSMVVSAAPKDKLEAHLFKFPLVGALPYQGFFNESDAARFEQELQSQGLDTYRRGVEAYSTTGWLPDPLLSTMFDSEARFIELLLHELTHTTFYFPSSADFNEAFASWMGFQAALAFVDHPKSSLINREDIKAQLQRSHRRQLKAAPWIQNALRKTRDFYEKGQVTEAERVAHFEDLARSAEKEGLFKVPASRWNNAFLLSLGTYYEMVPSIDAYAKNEKLSPPDFLKRVTARGPEIIPEIMKSK